MSEANTRWGILYCPKGRNSKQREKIQKVLDERLVQYDFVQSESSDSVERLMTMLIRNGYKTIIIVGGDSALNDSVNCLMNEEKQVRDQIALGVIPNGIVNDFAASDAIAIGSSGSLPGCMQRLWKSKGENTYHMEYGFSCMGYEICGALGAKLAAPGAR